MKENVLLFSNTDFRRCKRKQYLKNSYRECPTRPKYDLWTLRKDDSSTLKKFLQNTNEHTCNYLCYVTLLVCLRWSIVWFWGVIRKNTSYGKHLWWTHFMPANVLTSDSNRGAFPWILQNFQENLFCKTSVNRNFFVSLFAFINFFLTLWKLLM